MSLLSILKTIGNDLTHVGAWVDDALKLVEPVVAIVDPPLGPIFLAVEKVLDGLPAGTAVDSNKLQQIVKSATLATVGTKENCPCSNCPLAGKVGC